AGTGDIAYGAERVGSGADGEDPRAGGEAPLEGGPVELTRGAVERNRPDRDAALPLERPPWRHVRMVVEFGDDDLVARPPASAQRPREVERERGHVGAEHDLGGRGSEKIGESLACRGDQPVGLLARRVAAVGVRV